MLRGMQQMRLAVVVRRSRLVDNLTCGCCGLVHMWLPFVAEMCPHPKRRLSRAVISPMKEQPHNGRLSLVSAGPHTLHDRMKFHQ